MGSLMEVTGFVTQDGVTLWLCRNPVTCISLVPFRRATRNTNLPFQEASPVSIPRHCTSQLGRKLYAFILAGISLLSVLNRARRLNCCLSVRVCTVLCSIAVICSHIFLVKYLGFGDNGELCRPNTMIADDRPLYIDEETGTINMDIVKKQFMTPIPIAAPRFWRGANVGPIACGGRHLLI